MNDSHDARPLLIVTQYYSPEAIGTAPYAADLARWFAERGEMVDVITCRPFYPGTEVYAEYKTGERDRELIDGVTVAREKPFVPVAGGAVERLRSDLTFFARGLISLARRQNRRATHVISFCPSIFTVLLGQLATKRGGRHVAIVHDIQSGLARGLEFRGSRLFAHALRNLESFILNRADAVVVLSPEMAKQLTQLRVTVPIVDIPIWVDPSTIFPLPDPPNRPPTLLYSGNLGRKQGLSILTTLAEHVARLRPDVRILVRGNGNQEKAVLDDARARNLTNIHFEPLVPKERLNQALADGLVHLIPQDPNAADFALPSKLYTTLAAGRPAVATARPGSALWRLAEETKAFICAAPDDPEQFARAAIALIEDPARRAKLGRAGREYAENVVARDRVLAEYARLVADAEA